MWIISQKIIKKVRKHMYQLMVLIVGFIIVSCILTIFILAFAKILDIIGSLIFLIIKLPVIIVKKTIIK